MRILPVFSIRNVLLLTIGALTLMITLLVGHEVFIRLQQLNSIESLREASLLGDDLFDAGGKLSLERHISFTMLHLSNPSAVKDMAQSLADSRRNTDAAFKKIPPLLKDYSFANIHNSIQSVENKFKALQALRAEVDRASVLPLGQRDQTVADRWFEQSTDTIRQIQTLWGFIINDFIDVDPIVNAQMRFKYSLWAAMEYTGRERSLISHLIVENAAPTPQEQSQLLRWQGVVDYFWNSVFMAAEESHLRSIQGQLKDAKSDYDNVYDMIQGIFLLPGSRLAGPYAINAQLWLELSTQSDQSLYSLKNIVLKETRDYVDNLKAEVRQEIMVRSLALLLTLLLCAFSFRVVLVRVLAPISMMVEALINATQGKTVSPLLMQVRQDDEIGKLAHVLTSFQKNVEELKHSTFMLKLYNEELKRSNQELDDFAYIASHDLKEPLRGLITQTSFLLEDYQNKLDAEAIRRLRRLSYLSQRMEQLISDLLYYSRLGRTQLAIQETDPNEIIAEVRQMMDVFLKEHNARITVPNPMPLVTCDKLRITEVFRNLITNAVKYNDKPERLVEVGYLDSVKTPHGEERGVFYIRDNGIGIGSEFHDAIFRIFKRLKNPAIKDEEGTGSGLTFVKKIIERHKGHIWLESEPGKGATFYFTLGAK